MVKRIILMLILTVTVTVTAQEHDLLPMYNGNTLHLYLTVAPEFDEYVVVSRKAAGAGDFVALNDTIPMKQTEDEYRIRELLGDDADKAIQYLDVEDFYSLTRAIMGNSFRSSLATLIFPGAAEAAGRLYKDAGVTAGRDYEYKIQYFNTSGEEVKSFTKMVKAATVSPLAPSGLTASLKGALVTLNWTYPKWENDPSNLTVTYNVYRKDSGGKFVKSNTSIIVRNDASQPAYSEPVSPQEKTVEYYVTAVDPVGNESKPSNTFKLQLISEDIPEPPAELKATVAEDGIHLVWNMSTSADISGYNVYRKDSLRADSVKINKKLLDRQYAYFTDSLVKAGTMMYYFVTAVSQKGKESRMSGMASGEIIDVQAPIAPTQLKSSFAGNLVKLEWKPSTSKDTKHYNIYRGEGKSVLAKVGQTTSTTFTDNGYDGKSLVSGGFYFYSVTAVDWVNIESLTSDTIMVRYIDKLPPPAPSPVVAEVTGQNAVSVRAGMNRVSDLAKVVVSRKNVKTGKVEVVGTFTSIPVRFVDSTVVFLEKYIYSAQSSDSTGNKSEVATGDTVFVRSLTAPMPTPEVAAFLKDSIGVNIEWIPSAESDFAGYNIYVSELPNGVFKKVNTSLVKEAKYFHATGKEFTFYKVRVVNTSGMESEWSPNAAVTKMESGQ